jgi:hypothetical protein
MARSNRRSEVSAGSRPSRCLGAVHLRADEHGLPRRVLGRHRLRPGADLRRQPPLRTDRLRRRETGVPGRLRLRHRQHLRAEVLQQRQPVLECLRRGAVLQRSRPLPDRSPLIRWPRAAVEAAGTWTSSRATGTREPDRRLPGVRNCGAAGLELADRHSRKLQAWRGLALFCE